MPLDTQLLERLKQNDPTLTKINLYDEEINDRDVQALAKALEQNQTLSDINLSENKIGEDGAEALAKALENNQALSDIDLRGNKIGEDGAEALAKALEKNQTLRSINLASNGIGDGGVEALAKALEKNQTLRSINLADNEISDVGARALAKALEQNLSLTSINLNMNEIREYGAIALAKALEQNRTLTSISLHFNSIFDAGAQALAKALEQNRTLRDIWLSRNPIGKLGNQALVKALEQNRTLRCIDLGIISIAVAQALAKVLEQNRSLTYVFFNSKKIDTVLQDTIQALIERNCEYVKQCIIATEKKDIIKVRELVKTGINIDYEADRKRALHMTAAIGNEEIFMLLLMSGADEHLLVDGKVALQIAEKNNHQSIIALLQAKAQLPRPLLLQCDKIFTAYRQADYQSALTLCQKTLLVAAKNVWVIAMQKEIEQSLAYENRLSLQAEAAAGLQAIKKQAAILYQEAWQGYEADDLVKALTKFRQLQTLAPDLYSDVPELIQNLSIIVGTTEISAAPSKQEPISSSSVAPLLPPRPVRQITTSSNPLGKLPALEMHANNSVAEALFNQGYAKYNLGQYEAAIDDYNKAIELNPNYAAVFKNRGLAKIWLQQYEAAIIDFTKAIELNRSDAEAFYHRGFAKEWLQQHEAAILDFTKAIELKPSAEAFNHRGRSKEWLRQYETVIVDFSKALELDPSNADYLADLKRAKEALATTQSTAVPAETKKQHSTETVQFFQEAELIQVRTTWASKKPADILSAYESFIKKTPQLAACYRERGLFYKHTAEKATLKIQKKTSYEKALADFKQAIELDLFDTEAAEQYEMVEAQLSPPVAAPSSSITASSSSTPPSLQRMTSVTEFADLPTTLPAAPAKHFLPPTANVKAGFFKQPVAVTSTSAPQPSSPKVSSVNGLGGLLQASPGKRNSINTGERSLPSIPSSGQQASSSQASGSVSALKNLLQAQLGEKSPVNTGQPQLRR